MGLLGNLLMETSVKLGLQFYSWEDRLQVQIREPSIILLTTKHCGSSSTCVTVILSCENYWRDNTRENCVPGEEGEINKFDHQLCLYMGKWDQEVKWVTQCHMSCWRQWHQLSLRSCCCIFSFTFSSLKLPSLFNFSACWIELHPFFPLLSHSPYQSLISSWHL